MQTTIFKAGNPELLTSLNGWAIYYMNSALTVKKTNAGAFLCEMMKPIGVPAAHNRRSQPTIGVPAAHNELLSYVGEWLCEGTSKAQTNPTLSEMPL